MSDDKQQSNAPTPEAHSTRDGSPRPQTVQVEEQEASEQAAESESSVPEEQVGTPESRHDRKRQEDQRRLEGVIEALLLASEEPLTRKHIEKALPEPSQADINRAIEALKLEYAGSFRGIHLAEVAGGLEFRTNPEFKEHILEMYESRPTKVSRAAMETLAIIAYQQPLTRAEVEEIRGVDCSGVIRTLQDYDLVKTVGRLDDLGRPHIYGTTERFLEFFGLETLEDLPMLDEEEMESLDELYRDELENIEADAQAESEQEDGDAEEE
jgi:segregation and condensation protein B